jgi:hypothetical protein
MAMTRCSRMRNISARTGTGMLQTRHIPLIIRSCMQKISARTGTGMLQTQHITLIIVIRIITMIIREIHGFRSRD